MDEGKLLLFIHEEVVNRPPRTGTRLKAEKKRKAQDELEARKRRKGDAESRAGGGGSGEGGESAATAAAAAAEEGAAENPSWGDETFSSPLLLKYNTVRGYVSAVNELWMLQHSKGVHSAPRPQGVAMAALKSSIVRQQHARSRRELTDRGVGTIKDGYTASQNPRPDTRRVGRSAAQIC